MSINVLKREAKGLRLRVTAQVLMGKTLRLQKQQQQQLLHVTDDGRDARQRHASA